MSTHELPSRTEILQLRHEALECITGNILPFWLNHMQDQQRGGWYGQMTGRGKLLPDAPRGAILQARLLWTFAAAYRVLQHEEYLEAALRTKDYILRYFVDHQYGGTYWSVAADGQPLDTKKQFYAIGFMIYGFSELARATGDAEALTTALQLFDIIEQHAWDDVHGGYIEACQRDWQPIEDMRLSDKDENYPKSQNTHLHIIEPYANLCLALRAATDNKDTATGLSNNQLHGATQQVEAALRRLIALFTDRILNPATYHLDLFFAMDWSRMSETESYGHDIECSWLLHEAALVLGDKQLLEQVEPIVREVARASEKGLLNNGAMIHESGDRDLHWWVQAEAVVGFLNIYQHFEDQAALQKALHVWKYIKAHLIDYQHGEWYWSVKADGTLNLDEDHAGFWKCPYHNSRMCLEILQRFPAS